MLRAFKRLAFLSKHWDNARRQIGTRPRGLIGEVGSRQELSQAVLPNRFHTLLGPSVVFGTLAIYAAAPGPKQLLMVPGAGHVQAYSAANAEYERAVLDFLSRSFAQAR